VTEIKINIIDLEDYILKKNILGSIVNEMTKVIIGYVMKIIMNIVIIKKSR